MTTQRPADDRIHKAFRRRITRLVSDGRSLWPYEARRLVAAGAELSIYIDFQAEDHAKNGNGSYAGNYELLMKFLESGGVPDEGQGPESDLSGLTRRELLLAFAVNELDRALQHLEARPSRGLAHNSPEAPEAEALISAAIALNVARGTPPSRLAQ